MNEGMTFTFDEATGLSQRIHIDTGQEVSLQKWIEEERKRRETFLKEQEEKRKKEEEMIAKGEAIRDSRGNLVKLPTAILQERIVSKYIENGNEETDESYVELQIIEQQPKFRFEMYVDDDGTINKYDGKYFVKFVNGDCIFEQDFYESRSYKFYFTGNESIKDRHKFKVSLGEYNTIRKSFEESGIQIMADEKAQLEQTEEQKNISYIFRDKPTKKELEEMIALVDKKKFTQIIRARLIKDKRIDDISKLTDEWAKEYLATWAENKYKFFKMFGNKLTIEKEVEVQPTSEELQRKWKEVCNKFPLYRPILNNIELRTIIDNNIGKIRDYRIFSDYFQSSEVKENMSFTKFISLYGNKELDMEVSKMYQENGKAHLFISIDPVDYLTVSINGSGWESCHHFLKGCYRNAGLSYMNDRTSLVSYRSNGKHKYQLEGKNVEWNTKSWRQMIYIAEQNSTMVFSRQYPYESEELSWNIRQMMEEVISEQFGGQNKWKIFNKKNQANVSVQKGTGATLYNDVSNGFGHKVVKAKDDNSEREKVVIRIGTKVYGVISKEQIKRENDYIW